MENAQSPTNQNLTKTTLHQQTSTSNSKSLVVVIISVLLTAVITGAVVYFWQKSANEKVINGLEQKIDLLQKQASTINKIETTPQPTLQTTSPAPVNKTKNWEVYRNDNFGFQFSYPPEWDFNLGTGQAFLFQAFLKKEDSSQKPVMMPGDTTITPYYQILISVQDNPKNLSAKDFYLKDFALESRDEAEKRLKEVDIAGEDAIKYQEGTAPSSGLATTVSVSYDSKIYQLSYGAIAHEATHEKYLAIFNQILTTLQFN